MELGSTGKWRTKTELSPGAVRLVIARSAMQCYALVMRINWKDIFKFLSGAFFVTAGASWYLSWYHIGVPLFGFTMTTRVFGI
jgi:hypothetical protein